MSGANQEIAEALEEARPVVRSVVALLIYLSAHSHVQINGCYVAADEFLQTLDADLGK